MFDNFDPNLIPLLNEAPASVELTPDDLMNGQRSLRGYKQTLKFELGLTHNDPEFRDAVKRFKETYFQQIEDERVRLCGHLARKRSMKNGSVIEYNQPCNVFRKCPYCNERRKNENEERLKRLIGKKVITLDNDANGTREQAKIARRLGKENYYAEKTDDGKIHIVFEANDDLSYFEQRWQLGSMTNTQAEEIAERSIPEKGNRQSGNLGKEEKYTGEEEETKKENDCDCEDGKCIVCCVAHAIETFDDDIARAEDKLGEVYQRPVKMDCADSTARLVTAKAVQNLGNPTFEVIADMQDYINRYEAEIERIAKKRNIVILFLQKRPEEINLNDIDWKDAEEIARELELRA